MDELIKRIIEIENKAQSVIKDARAEQSRLDDDIARTIADMKAEVLSRAEKRCREIRVLEDSDAEKKIAGMSKENAAAAARLESIYKEKCDKWVNDIAEGIINS